MSDPDIHANPEALRGAAEAALASYDFCGLRVLSRDPQWSLAEDRAELNLTASGPAHAGSLALRFHVTFDEDGSVVEANALNADGAVVGTYAGGSAFYRSVLHVEVLTQDTLLNGLPLETIGREMDQGAFVGNTELVSVQRLTRAQMAAALVSVGSDPGFFMLEEEGDEPPRPAGPAALDTTAVRAALQPEGDYEGGYADALESMGLALLAAGVPAGTIHSAWTTALDAVANAH